MKYPNRHGEVENYMVQSRREQKDEPPEKEWTGDEMTSEEVESLITMINQKYLKINKEVVG